MFVTGGEGTWRQFLTLPNILKMFNPNLTGYSVGKGEFLSPNSHMNVAIPVSADYDALKQAKMLVSKMKKDPKVDFNNDWKVNFKWYTEECGYCYLICILIYKISIGFIYHYSLSM